MLKKYFVKGSIRESKKKPLPFPKGALDFALIQMLDRSPAANQKSAVIRCEFF